MERQAKHSIKYGMPNETLLKYGRPNETIHPNGMHNDHRFISYGMPDLMEYGRPVLNTLISMERLLAHL